MGPIGHIRPIGPIAFGTETLGSRYHLPPMPVFLRWFLRLGPTNPIAVRLVQNGSRRTKHMYIRAIYLAVLVVVLLWSMLLGSASSDMNMLKMAATGAANFINISYLQIFLICILAPVFMGGAIAQE